MAEASRSEVADNGSGQLPVPGNTKITPITHFVPLSYNIVASGGQHIIYKPVQLSTGIPRAK